MRSKFSNARITDDNPVVCSTIPNFYRRSVFCSPGFLNSLKYFIEFAFSSATAASTSLSDPELDDIEMTVFISM